MHTIRKPSLKTKISLPFYENPVSCGNDGQEFELFGVVTFSIYRHE